MTLLAPSSVVRISIILPLPGSKCTRSQHERFAVAIDDEIMVTDRLGFDLVQGA
jgi:hypothetical protein